MAHNLATLANGQAAFMYVGEAAWHGLGIKVEGMTVIMEAVGKIGADGLWRCDPITWNGQWLGDLGIDDKCYVTVRSDGKVGGVVGKDYHILQPRDAFGDLQPAIDSGLATIETVGQLSTGATWVLLKVNKSTTDVVKGDPVDLYVLAVVGFDGKLSYFLGFTATRVVCQNTLFAALSKDADKLLKFRHTKSVARNAEAAQAAICKALADWKQAVEIFRALSAAQVQHADVIKAYVDTVFKTPKRTTAQDRIDAILVSAATGEGAIAQEVKRNLGVDGVFDSLLQKPVTLSAEPAKYDRKDRVLERITDLFEGEGAGATLQGVRGTWWGLYNAATQYMTHERGRSEESRFDTVMLGGNGGMAQRAYDTALDMSGLKAA